MPSQLTWNLRGRTVTVGLADPPTTDISCQIVMIGPVNDPQITTVPATACADPRQDITSVIRNLSLSALSDWDTASGLSWFLADHDRQSVWFQVAAGVGKGGWKAQVTALYPPWDAVAGTPHQYSLTLPVLSFTGIKPT